MLDEPTKDFIRRVLSVAECDRERWKADAVYIYADDNRFNPGRKQITLSIGFTESGNLKKVLQCYIAKGGKLAGDFQPFMVHMGSKDHQSLCHSTRFIELLKVAGKDPVMIEGQEESFDQLYLGPAFTWAEQHGFTLPLSYLVIADSFLHSGSMLGFLMAKFPEKKPVDGGGEKTWINAYLSARHSWLRNHSNAILNKTIYRADCYLREATKGNWDLMTGPLVMNGTPIHRVA